jgi:PAS domain S-box-containing protein
MPEGNVTRDLYRLQRARKAENKRIEEKTSKLDETRRLLQREVAAREHAEKETRLLLTLIETIGNAKDFQAALDLTLQTVCKFSSWDYGEAWILNGEKSALALAAFWHKEENKLADFVSSTKIRSFPFGVGLPGRVWASRQPEWAPDLTKGTGRLRRPLLLRAGVKSSAGFPVMAAGEIVAVLVFFMLEKRSALEHQIEVVGAVARQLGSVIQHKQIEEEARKHHTLMQAVMDNSTRVIYVKDPQGRYITVNREFEVRHEITRDQIRGKTAHDIFPGESADALSANDAKVLSAAAPMEFEESIDHKDGRRSFIVNKFPLFDSSGVLYAVCGIATDITEQKRLQEDLRSARDVFSAKVQKRTAELVAANQALLLANTQKDRALLELQRERDFSANLLNTAQVIVLVLDPHGRVVYFNPFFEQLTGHSLEQSKGQDWFMNFLPQRDSERIRELFHVTLGGRPTNGNRNPVLAKDGKELEVEWSATLLRGGDGRIIGLLCTGIDVTERKKAEAWLQGFINSTQDAVISIGSDGRIQTFNPAAEEMFGYGHEEILGRSVALLIPELHSSMHGGYIARYEETGQAWAIGRNRILTARRKSGELFPVGITITRVATEGSVAYGAVLRDLSERVRLQERLVEAERLAVIGATAAKIGHELANPLNGLYLTVQLLEQRLARQPQPLDSEVDSNLRNIKGEITRLNQLVQEFRTLSRKEKYRFRPASLTRVIDDVVELQRPSFAAAGIRLEQRLAADLPAVVMDNDRIKQAVLNLLKNAMESMPGGGDLFIRAMIVDDEVVIEVSDTGTGIPPGTDVFLPFFTTKDQGTGLGLIVVRQIVSIHGGTVTYASEPGKGTTFRIALPIKQQTSDKAAT